MVAVLQGHLGTQNTSNSRSISQAIEATCVGVRAPREGDVAILAKLPPQAVSLYAHTIVSSKSFQASPLFFNSLVHRVR